MIKYGDCGDKARMIEISNFYVRVRIRANHVRVGSLMANIYMVKDIPLLTWITISAEPRAQTREMLDR